jgi:hypothetical protein
MLTPSSHPLPERKDNSVRSSSSSAPLHGSTPSTEAQWQARARVMDRYLYYCDLLFRLTHDPDDLGCTAEYYARKNHDISVLTLIQKLRENAVYPRRPRVDALWDEDLFLLVVELIEEQIALLAEAWRLMAEIVSLTGVEQAKPGSLQTVRAQQALLEPVTARCQQLKDMAAVQIDVDASEEQVIGRVSNIALQVKEIVDELEKRRKSLAALVRHLHIASEGAKWHKWSWYAVGALLLGAGGALAAPVALPALAAAAAIEGLVTGSILATSGAIALVGLSVTVVGRSYRHLDGVLRALRHGTLADINITALAFHSRLNDASAQRVQEMQRRMDDIFHQDAQHNVRVEEYIRELRRLVQS